jgi:hypothetical protein
MLGNMFANSGPKSLNAEGAHSKSFDAADAYNKTVARSQQNKAKVTGAIDTASNVAMMIPGIGTGIGLAMKGASAVVKALPWGQNKADKAMNDFNLMDQSGRQEDTSMLANANMNRYQYKAADYGVGRKGLKITPSNEREFYESQKNREIFARKRNKTSKSKFTKP